jgi:hypothetical protein
MKGETAMTARRRRHGKKKTTRRRAPVDGRRHHIGPLAHLARKVQGLDARVEHIEGEVKGFPTHYRRKKHKLHGLGSLEDNRGHEYWATGE